MPKFYEPEQLKHLQKLEMEILTDFKRICDENNLIYFEIGRASCRERV